ncbi:capsular exopolysaccharide synthesis family protein [Actinomycetospora corticicola]|uniref:non-specific protein-tyrosine kinase n=1 Tax=Actinomycetospora corticicola TaxID=663602 RepID=A0A7Y9DS56_9PSEU|nr:capsular exopolysaccharide synthesis family protein [Actinomycetospora corticicola]
MLRSRWRVTLCVALIGILTGLLTYLLTPSSYTAVATLYVNATVTNSPNNAYQGAQLSAQRVASYTELATSTRVSRQVVQDLGLPQTPEALSRQLSASSPSGSVVITLSARDALPDAAVAIVNDTANVFTNLVNELERPDSSLAVQAVDVRVVEPAITASVTSLGLRSALLYGAISGIALGVGAAFLYSSLDNRIRSAGALSDATELPILGSIPKSNQPPSSDLLMSSAGSGLLESYRALRTNLQYIEIDRPPRVLVVTSPGEGEGKSTTAINTAIALGLAGSRVLLVDCDLRRPQVADRLGINNDVGLTSVLSGKTRADDATQSWNRSLIHVLPSGPLPPNPSELLGSQHMHRTIAHLRSTYDYVVLDTPPVIPVTDAAALAPASDGVLLVVASGRTRVPQVDASKKTLTAVGSHILGCVLNLAPQQSGEGSYYGPLAGAVSKETSISPQDLVSDESTLTMKRHGATGESSRPQPGPRQR